MPQKTYKAGVKDYRENYWTPDYTPLDTDLLACFKIVPQAGVPREEIAAAVAAESSTGTWTTVWTDMLTDIDYYKGRAYRIEPVPGDNTAFYAFVAYPIDLFEEGSVVNVLTSLVGNVFGFKALRSLRLEDLRFPIAYVMTCGGPPNGIQVERDRLNKYGRAFLGCTIKPKLGLSAKNYDLRHNPPSRHPMKKFVLSLATAGLLAFAAAPLTAADTAPKSVIHVVTVSFKADAKPEQIKAALDGVKALPAAYKGITRVWTRAIKVQGGKTHAIVMEFADEAALKAYTDSPAQKDWYKLYIPVRDSSTTFDITN